MAVLAVTPVIRTGTTDVTVSASAGGDLLPNTGKEWVEVINGGGGAITVTASGYVDAQVVAIQAVSVGAGVRRKIGPFPPHIYNNTSQQVAITYSGVTTVTVGAYSLGTS
jgi:hypothetical protein